MSLTPKSTRAEPDPAASFRLDEHLFYYFSQIMGLRNRRLNADLRGYGLDFARWRVMAVLSLHRGCSLQHLSEVTSVDRTSLTHTLRLMENEGLISRDQRPEDRRSIALSLTPAGQVLLETILPTVLAQTSVALKGFDGAEFSELLRQLARIVDNLKCE